MSKASTITHERLKSLLRYEPETGHFFWLATRGPRHPGDIAGTVTTQGYRQLTIDTIQVRANRMAFLYMTGRHPSGQIDHINGVRSDDRWENLRNVTPSMNQHNRRKADSKSQSGLLGVIYLKRLKKWTSRLRSKGKDFQSGLFQTKEEAHAAYIQMKRRLHEGCTI